MEDAGLVEPRGMQGHFECGGDVLGLHRGAQLPGDDVAGEVVADRRQVEPSPADDLEISEVRLPELVWCRRLVAELIRSLHHDEGRTGDQITGLEQPINRGLRDKIAFGVGEAHGQFPRRQRRLVQRQVDDALTDIVGDAVPDAVRPGMSVVQSFWSTGPIQVVPTVEGGTRNADLFRAGFRRYWRWRSRSLGGRPQIDAELRALIRRMSADDPLWGAPRIHGELLKLGFEVAQSSVAKYMVKRCGPPSQGWRTFLVTMRPTS